MAALFLPIHGVMAFLLDLGVCLLMCIGTFAGKSVRPRQILWIFLVYFGVSFAVGGVMSGMATFAEAAIHDGYLDEIREGDKFTVEASK